MKIMFEVNSLTGNDGAINLAQVAVVTDIIEDKLHDPLVNSRFFFNVVMNNGTQFSSAAHNRDW